MSNQKSWFDRAMQVAQDLGEAASDASSHAGQFVEEATLQLQKVSNEATSHLTQTVSENISKLKSPEPHGVVDLSQVDESTRIAFYGALFAIATADGQIDKEEMELIFGIMDLDHMSEDSKRTVQSYAIVPPPLQDCLR